MQKAQTFVVFGGVVDTSEQFIAGVNDIGDKFFPGVVDTGQK